RDGASVVAIQSDWQSSISVGRSFDSQSFTRLMPGTSEGYGGLTWLPPSRVVYVSRDWDLYITDVDGVHPRVLRSGHDSRNPFGSPEGRYVFFESWRSGKNHIWRIDADGSDAIEVTRGEADVLPRVTRDGK